VGGICKKRTPRELNTVSTAGLGKDPRKKALTPLDKTSPGKGPKSALLNLSKEAEVP